MARFAVPFGIGAIWFIFPGIGDETRAVVGLPASVAHIASQIKYAKEEEGTMPTVK
jgi:hypothetical protein